MMYRFSQMRKSADALEIVLDALVPTPDVQRSIAHNRANRADLVAVHVLDDAVGAEVILERGQVVMAGSHAAIVRSPHTAANQTKVLERYGKVPTRQPCRNCRAASKSLHPPAVGAR